jgi:hypothetical protein
MGRPHVYDLEAAEEFARLLMRWGPPGYLDEKERLRAAIAGGGEPRAYLRASTRSIRAATRVALRQFAACNPGYPELEVWLAALDRAPMR